MALKTTAPAPPRHFRAQTARELREIRRRIDAAEFETEQGTPSPVTADPYLLRPAPPPLRLIKPAPEPAICGFGTCAVSPACTRTCRYREADVALRGHYVSERSGLINHQRAPLPEPKADHRLRRAVVIGLLVYAVAFVATGVWLFTS